MAVKTLPIDELEYLLSPFQISILLFMHAEQGEQKKVFNEKALAPHLHKPRGAAFEDGFYGLDDLGLVMSAGTFFMFNWTLTKWGKKVCKTLLAAGWGLTDG